MPKKSKPTKVSLGLRVQPEVKERLDVLCKVNRRSIPELFEILINKHYDDLLEDQNIRINP